MSERDERVDWHGWKIGTDGTQLHVGPMPGRVNPMLSLAVVNGYCAQIAPLASFRSEECARRFQAVLDGWTDRMNQLERELAALKAAHAPPKESSP